MGNDANPSGKNAQGVGVIFCTMIGCVNYSRRFYDETLKDPATASPLIFPETVFNAPASHLAAVLGATGLNYTLVGDPGTFLQGIALAADWLTTQRVEACVVVGAEEMDWLAADAVPLFHRQMVVSDGAGAVYLKSAPAQKPGARLAAISDAHLFSQRQSRAQAARNARGELKQSHHSRPEPELLCDGIQGVARLDRDEQAAWDDWGGPRLSPKNILGEGYMAASAWQCVAAVDALEHGNYSAANVSIVGCNQQAVAARFVK
jgi:3-oxoacyl-(acyl-carrier-protein) synthase